MSNRLNQQLGLGLGPKTIKNIKGYLSMALNFGVQEELLPSNPASHIKIAKVPKPQVGCFTLKEMRAFLAVKDDYEYGDAFAIKLSTGVRPEELFAFIEEDIDFERCTLRVERAAIWLDSEFIGFGPPKTDNGYRTIDITRAEADYLRERLRMNEEAEKQRKKEGLPYGEPKINTWIKEKRKTTSHLYPSRKLLFCNPAGCVPQPHVIRRCYKAMLKGAGFSSHRLSLRLYDVRHTNASYLLMRGVPPIKVAKRLGHTVGVLHGFYEHLIPDMSTKLPSQVFAEELRQD
jgi:integrase